MNRIQFSSVQSLSRVQLFATPWTAARQASLSITNSQSLLKLMSIEWVMPSNHLLLCHPLLLLPSIFPGIRVFSSQDHRLEETKKQSPEHWAACLLCDKILLEGRPGWMWSAYLHKTLLWSLGPSF